MANLSKWLTKLSGKLAKKAGKYLPVVKVFQASHGVQRTGQAVSKVIEVGDTIKETLPAMRLMVGSVCDNLKFILSFVNLAHTAGIAANLMQTYQGVDAVTKIGARLDDISNTLEAQTVLQARKEFADFIYDKLRDPT